jgi:hypothetical protein
MNIDNLTFGELKTIAAMLPVSAHAKVAHQKTALRCLVLRNTV